MHATCLRCHRTIGTSGRESGRPRKDKFATFHAAIFCVVMLSKGGEQTRRRGGLWLVAVVEAEVVAEAVARAPIARR